MAAKTTQLLSSGELRKLRYHTVPVKSASANVSFYTNNSKMHKFSVVTLLSYLSDIMKMKPAKAYEHIIYYEHSKLPTCTCFGHCCGHPQGGVNIKDVLQKLMHKYKIQSFKMHVL